MAKQNPAPVEVEVPEIPPLYNVVDWEFPPHQFKADTDFHNPDPKIPDKYVLRAIDDGLLRAK